MQLSENFHAAEFSCKCGDCEWKLDGKPDLALLAVLESVRAKFGPVTITPNGGRRCPPWNAKCGGAPMSQHQLGRAADIVVTGVSPGRVYKFLVEHPLAERLGLGNYYAFTHVDVRGTRARWVG